MNFIVNFSTDQLNTTIHGTMKTTPYELVYGQPPLQNFFPGAHGTDLKEEDVEDILPVLDPHSLDQDQPTNSLDRDQPPHSLNQAHPTSYPSAQSNPLGTSGKHLNI